MLVVRSISTLTGPGGTGIVVGVWVSLRGVAGVAVACVDQRYGSQCEREAFGRVCGVRGRVDGDADRPVRVWEAYVCGVRLAHPEVSPAWQCVVPITETVPSARLVT